MFHLIWLSFESNTVHERDENGPLNFTTCFLKASCFENLSFFFQLLNSSFLQVVRFFSIIVATGEITRFHSEVCVSTLYKH